MYKLNVNKEDIRKFDKEALICELGFYIGTKKEIDEYIKKNILGIEHNADEYFVFYMFCKFVVEKFFDSGVQDIYELIDYNYIRLVGMFKTEMCENKVYNYDLVITTDEGKDIGVLRVKNGCDEETCKKMIKDIIGEICNDKVAYLEDYDYYVAKTFQILNKKMFDTYKGSAYLVKNISNDINIDKLVDETYNV